jgi:hypothetical protein
MLAVTGCGARADAGDQRRGTSKFLHAQGGALMGFLDMFSGGALSK